VKIREGYIRYLYSSYRTLLEPKSRFHPSLNA